MRNQLIQYVNLLFAGSQDTYEIHQEILQNTLDRYDDLIEQGKSPEAAYRLAISGIGDINEILGTVSPAASTASVTPAEDAAVDYRGRPIPSTKKKTMQAVAIGMYICCVVPVIALGNIGDGVLGVCLMFLMIAAATVLIILSGGNKQEAETDPDEPKTELSKAIQSIFVLLTLGIYLGISFWSGAWYITWLVFPIMSAIHGIIKAILDIKEANKHET